MTERNPIPQTRRQRRGRQPAVRVLPAAAAALLAVSLVGGAAVGASASGGRAGHEDRCRPSSRRRGRPLRSARLEQPVGSTPASGRQPRTTASRGRTARARPSSFAGPTPPAPTGSAGSPSPRPRTCLRAIRQHLLVRLRRRRPTVRKAHTSRLSRRCAPATRS